jgi:hypothetical protein
MQSRGRTDAEELQDTKNSKDSLELVVEQVKLETREEKKFLDKGLETIYASIPDIVKALEKSVEEKISLIS